jgi:hypothetical protein
MEARIARSSDPERGWSLPKHEEIVAKLRRAVYGDEDKGGRARARGGTRRKKKKKKKKTKKQKKQKQRKRRRKKKRSRFEL